MPTPDPHTTIASNANTVRHWAAQFANGFNQVGFCTPLRAAGDAFDDGNMTIRLHTAPDPNGGTPSHFAIFADIKVDGAHVFDAPVQELPDAFVALLLDGLTAFNNEIVTVIKAAKTAAAALDITALDTAAQASYQQYNELIGVAFPAED